MSKLYIITGRAATKADWIARDIAEATYAQYIELSNKQALIDDILSKDDWDEDATIIAYINQTEGLSSYDSAKKLIDADKFGFDSRYFIHWGYSKNVYFAYCRNEDIDIDIHLQAEESNDLQLAINSIVCR